MRNTILRLLGYGHLIAFIDEFDYQASQSDNNSVRVYPSGLYFLDLEGLEDEDLCFDTPMERASFVRGLQFAGKKIYNFQLSEQQHNENTEDFYCEMSEMDKILFKKKPRGNA